MRGVRQVVGRVSLCSCFCDTHSASGAWTGGPVASQYCVREGAQLELSGLACHPPSLPGHGNEAGGVLPHACLCERVCEMQGSEAIPPPRGLEGGVCLGSWYDPHLVHLRSNRQAPPPQTRRPGLGSRGAGRQDFLESGSQSQCSRPSPHPTLGGQGTCVGAPKSLFVSSSHCLRSHLQAVQPGPMAHPH